jgi:hypothetical protein
MSGVAGAVVRMCVGGVRAGRAGMQVVSRCRLLFVTTRSCADDKRNIEFTKLTAIHICLSCLKSGDENSTASRRYDSQPSATTASRRYGEDQS